MNIRAAIIHIIGDIVQSIGVVIAAIIIYFKPDWHIVDPICTFIFTILCLFTTIPIFRDCVAVLMESTPKNIDVAECFNELISLESVEEIHDFHVWSLSVGKLAMSGHIRATNPDKALK
jgi:zinc transporter 2